VLKTEYANLEIVFRTLSYFRSLPFHRILFPFRCKLYSQTYGVACRIYSGRHRALFWVVRSVLVNVRRPMSRKFVNTVSHKLFGEFRALGDETLRSKGQRSSYD